MEEYKEGELCPVCSQGKLRKKIVDQSFNYKGRELTIPNYTIYVCSSCNEELVDEKTINAAEKNVRDFHRKVDNLLTSAEIVAIRKKLGLTQAGLAEKLGISRITIARYESGKLTQNKSQDIHLRLLIENPNCLISLQSEEGLWANKLVGKSMRYYPEKVFNYNFRITPQFALNDELILIEENYHNGKKNEEALAA